MIRAIAGLAFVVAMLGLYADVEAITIQEQALGRRSFPPFATGDGAIKMDVTFTSLAIAQAAGFIEEGTGITYSPNGFNGHATGNLYAASWPSYASIANQGTLYIQFERSAITGDNSNNATDSFFHDTTGQDSAAAKRYLFQGTNGATTYSRNAYHQDGAAPGFFAMKYIVNSATIEHDITWLNSHFVPNEQTEYADLVLTWRNTRFYWYLDGVMIATGESAVMPTSDDWRFLRIGHAVSAGVRLGNYNIKRVQISTYYCPPVMSPIRVALYGDSFMRYGSESTVPASATVAAINAVQWLLREFPVGYSNSTPTGRTGLTPFALGLRALGWQQLGFSIPTYIASCSGCGYEKTPMGAAYADAVNAYRAEIVIAQMSVNDVDPTIPVSNLVANTKATLDALIDGNSHLRSILFFVGVTGSNDPTTVAAYSAGAYLAETKRVRQLYLDSDLNGYRDKVRMVDVYSCWGGDAYPAGQTIGSAPDNTAPYAGGVHPSPTGQTVITKCFWPSVRELLSSRPRR